MAVGGFRPPPGLNRVNSLDYLAARLQNHNATDDGNVDFRSFKKKNLHSKPEKKIKVVDLLVQKLLNDMNLD